MDLEVVHTLDGSPTLLNMQLNVTYHSKHGAIQESRHIYINAGLHYAINTFGKNLNVLEIGFGTGLNALLSFEVAQKNGLSINYIGLEKYPITIAIAEKLEYAEMIGASFKEPFKTMHNCDWNSNIEIDKQFKFVKHLTDVNDFNFPKDIHVVYYDAFDPETSPEMWKPEIFKKLKEALLPKACMVTFCAKGEIKRKLKQIGFVVESLAGPPGKREMTRAVKPYYHGK